MNAWSVQKGAWAEYTLAEKEFVREIRIAFDSDLKRDHLNMVSNYTLIPAAYKVPETLVQKFRVEVDGEVLSVKKTTISVLQSFPAGKSVLPSVWS
jgi:DMSO/TMAO reductase YedYZ molybdopterin-dependent catalytic subunit